LYESYITTHFLNMEVFKVYTFHNHTACFSNIYFPNICRLLNKNMNELIEHTIINLNKEPDDGMTQLNKTSLSSSVINGFLDKSKQYANQIDQEVRNLKNTAKALQSSRTQEETNTILANALSNIGTLFYLQRKMNLYGTLTSSSTGIGVDKGKE